jgi:hypothetical protein
MTTIVLTHLISMYGLHLCDVDDIVKKKYNHVEISSNMKFTPSFTKADQIISNIVTCTERYTQLVQVPEQWCLEHVTT